MIFACAEGVRLPERSEPRRGRKGPSEEEVVEVGFDEPVVDSLPEVAFGKRHDEAKFSVKRDTLICVRCIG